MKTTIRHLLGVVLLSTLCSLPGAASTIINYSAAGIPGAPTTGADPYGNQWQISQFGVDTVWGIPGLPSVFSGSGPWQCVGFDCLQSVTVTAWEVGPLGDTALPIDAGGGLNLFRNVTTGANFLVTILGNSITFTAPSVGDYIRTGQFINSGVFVSNPGGSSDNVRFDVTYNLADCDVPEPGTYALVGSALAAVSMWKRRSRM